MNIFEVIYANCVALRCVKIKNFNEILELEIYRSIHEIQFTAIFLIFINKLLAHIVMQKRLIEDNKHSHKNMCVIGAIKSVARVEWTVAYVMHINSKPQANIRPMCPTSNLDSADRTRHDGDAIPRYRLASSHATSLRGYSANYRSAAVDAAARREHDDHTSKAWT